MNEPLQQQNALDISDHELQAAIYFAIGVSSENSDKAYRLVVAGDRTSTAQIEPAFNSGYSIGTLQTDLGQHYQPGVQNGENVPRDLIHAFQSWAEANHPDWFIADNEAVEQAIRDLGRNGRQIKNDEGRDLDSSIKNHLNAFLESNEGISWVHARDVAQITKLMNHAIAPLKATDAYRDADQEGRIRLAIMVAKVYNQSEAKGRALVNDIQDNEYDTIPQVHTAIGSMNKYIVDGRDGALEGAKIFIALKNSHADNPLNNAWRNVTEVPLTNPTQLQLDQARPNLEAEYSTIKRLFVDYGRAESFIEALDHGAAYRYGRPQPEGKLSATNGMYAAGDDFVVWGRDGKGHSHIGGTWNELSRDDITKTKLVDGSVDLNVSHEGNRSLLLHVDPKAPPLRPDQPAAALLPESREPEIRANGRASSQSEARSPDPRDTNHPDHALHNSIRNGLLGLYASHGVSIEGERLERLTAGVMTDARRAQVSRVDAIFFSEDRSTGKVETNGNVFTREAIQGDLRHPGCAWSATNVPQAFETPVEDSYKRFEAITQQQTQDWQRVVAQEQDLSQGRGMHRSF